MGIEKFKTDTLNTDKIKNLTSIQTPFDCKTYIQKGRGINTLVCKINGMYRN